jgi:Calcineurin-like phosphoesterase
VVRVLAVSDVVDEALWADPAAVHGVELIVACGDLPFEYLGYLMNALDVPLVFVPGNHDPDVSGYRISRAGLPLRAGLPARPPWPDGAINGDGRIVDIAGLRIAGLGGSRRYSDGANQYTDRQQARRARVLALQAMVWRLRHGSGGRGRRLVDVLLTHAPPAGVGDGPDPPHWGFPAINALARRLRPGLLLHGHVDPGPVAPQNRHLGETIVRNVTGWHLLDVEPGVGLAGVPAPSQPSTGPPRS